jgi:hypothetical protein
LGIRIFCRTGNWQNGNYWAFEDAMGGPGMSCVDISENLNIRRRAIYFFCFLIPSYYSLWSEFCSLSDTYIGFCVKGGVTMHCLSYSEWVLPGAVPIPHVRRRIAMLRRFRLVSSVFRPSHISSCYFEYFLDLRHPKARLMFVPTLLHMAGDEQNLHDFFSVLVSLCWSSIPFLHVQDS